VPRAFLSSIAALAVTSWAGIALAEIGRFSALLALGAGALAGAAAWARLARSRVAGLQGACTVALFAIVLGATLLPPVDTTLTSQDASIHLAAGKWLARQRSLAIPDPLLAGLSQDERFALFQVSNVGNRMSQSRLPGGIVLPRLDATTAYPSFAHLLTVWIAIAEQVGGRSAVRALGVLFAVTAWWAIGLVALLDAGLGAALAAIALLATWLPEHWFARFLMPEVLTQALLWSGVAAMRLAERSGAAPPDAGSGGSRDARYVAAVVGGLSLGVAGFARVEQLLVFLPALVLARALTPETRRVLPRGALLPFAVVSAHALLHLAIVPTDYGSRIATATQSALGHAYVLLTIPRVRLALGFCALLMIGVPLALRRRPHKGLLFLRLLAGAAAVGAFAALYHVGLPRHLAALHWLVWYVPWPVFAAALLGLPAAAPPTGIGLAVSIEAIDQLLNPRVTLEQIWASRRLVTVVLPLIALAASRALAGASGQGRLRRNAARILLAASIALGAFGLRPVLWHRVQQGSDQLVRRLAAALPASSYTVCAADLDWLHVAPALWLGHDRQTIVAWRQRAFGQGLAAILDRLPEASLFALGGGVAAAEGDAEPAATPPPLPEGYFAEPLETFRWPLRRLETTADRPPKALVERNAAITLFRLRRRPAETP
jgi:hypothetical protein